jgi:hypothetical protein
MDTACAPRRVGTEPEQSAIGDMIRYLNPRGFGQGVQAAVSTTSGVFTASSAAAWVEIEIVQL